MRRYVVVGSGVKEVDEGSDKPTLEDERFASETRSLLYLYGGSKLNKSYKQCFSEFHDFTVDSGLQWHQYWQQTEKFVFATKH